MKVSREGKVCERFTVISYYKFKGMKIKENIRIVTLLRREKKKEGKVAVRKVCLCKISYFDSIIYERRTQCGKSNRT